MHFYKLWDGNFFWPKCTVLLVFFSYTNVQYFWYFFDPNVQYFWYFFLLSQIYSTFGFFSDSKCTVLLVFYFSDPNVQYFWFFYDSNVQYFWYFFFWPKMYSTFFTGTGTNPAWVTMRREAREASRDWQGAQTCLQEELILAFNILA